MNRFYIITNSEKDKNLETTKRIYNYLTSHGRDCTVREYQKQDGSYERGSGRYTDADWFWEETGH